MSGALCFRPDGSETALVFAKTPGASNDEVLMEFLLELHRHLDGDTVILIWDGLPSHCSRAMQRFLASHRHWLVAEPLPASADDLNPVEQVWGSLKRHELANLCADIIDAAAGHADRGLCRLGNDTELSFAFLRHSGRTL